MATNKATIQNNIKVNPPNDVEYLYLFLYKKRNGTPKTSNFLKNFLTLFIYFKINKNYLKCNLELIKNMN